MNSFGEMSTIAKAKEKREFAVRLGKRLRSTRLEKGLTQEKLADRAGYHATYIGNVENATNLPSSHTVWRLAKEMDVDLGELLSGI